MTQSEILKATDRFFTKQPFWDITRKRTDTYLRIEDETVRIIRYGMNEGTEGLDCIPGVGQIGIMFSVQEKEAKAYLYGVLPEKKILPQYGIKESAQLQFSPASFSKLTGLPSADIPAEGLLLTDVFPWAVPFIEEVNSVDNGQEHCEVISKFLQECVRKKSDIRETDKELASSIVNYLMKYRKVIRMKELEQEYGFCARTIQKAVVSNVGVTPKQLNFQICLQNAIQTIAEKPDLSLTDLTYQMQFYDQSHFGSVFRRMTGVCPGQYQKWLQTEKEGEKCAV